MKVIYKSLLACGLFFQGMQLAEAASCSAYTYTFTNGQTADANAVMANFNQILNCANTNLAPLNGAAFTGTTTFSGGNVGIGTTNISGALTVANGTDHTLNVRGDPASFGLPTGLLGPILQGVNNTQTASEPITLFGGNINLMGAVGIGNAAPSWQLHVGSGSITGVVAGFQNSAALCTFTPTSSSPTWSCSSDSRLKKEISDAGRALPWLEDMRIRDFKLIATGDRQIGVIAQELQTNHPDMVHMGLDGFFTVDSPNPWQLVKAVQELKFDNDELKAANLKLEERIIALEQANSIKKASLLNGSSSPHPLKAIIGSN